MRPVTPAASQPATDPRRALGRLGEDLAVTHLERLGFAVLARNVRTRHGEIDLIACDGRVLAFVEVKSRRARGTTAAAASGAGSAGSGVQPLAGLRASQRARLRRLAAAWLADAGAGRPWVATLRFDAIGVLVDARGRLLRLDHVENAW